MNRMIVFDTPTALMPFESRYGYIIRGVDFDNAILVIFYSFMVFAKFFVNVRQSQHVF